MTLDSPWGYENFRLHEFFSSYYLFISLRFVLIAFAFTKPSIRRGEKNYFKFKTYVLSRSDITLQKSLAPSAFLSLLLQNSIELTSSYFEIGI